MKKISILLVCAICLLFLGGCWDKQELEDNIFVVFLGLDRSSEKDVIVTIAFPLTQTEEGGINLDGGGSGGYSVMSVKAPTVMEGLNMFTAKLSGPLALYTVKTIVISQELAENDILRHVFSSWRYEEIRNTTNVLISECGAAEFIEARINKSPIDPLRQEELLLEQTNDSSYYKPVQLLEFLTGLKSNSGDGVAMYGGIAADDEDKANDSQRDNKGQNKDGYLPGDLPITAANESQLSGLAVFHGAKMVGVLNSAEVQTYSILTQGKTKKILTLPDPLDPESRIVVAIMPAGKNKINCSLDNDVPLFDIDVALTCSVESIQSEIDYTLPQNYDILTEYIKEICAQNMSDLITKTQKEYNADILKLGNKLAYCFRTVNEWETYNWPEKYRNAVIHLNVKLDIERTGIMMP